MARLREIKRILDSVHGQIKVPVQWCEQIIDTPFFQRLRRIEQNSCRSVFPSARHDRFIHSLGVFHIGSLIVDHLISEYADLEGNEKILPENYKRIFHTYKLACLLHDVGHTPFSHTFEIFFDEHKMREALRDTVEDEKFSFDLNGRNKCLTEHEVLSAYVGVKAFKEPLNDDLIDWTLFVRMIIGLPYLDETDQIDTKRFENIMIELIHGTIDADGLDYVCRDVWAGGYHNFSIDLPRLIEAIEIKKEETGSYTLAFSSKALNEIEGVLNIKNFQFLYVINHHKVLIEQEYLKEAMKEAAIHHTGELDKEKAIRKLCDYNAFVEPIELKATHYKLYRPCDDDFVVLMKHVENVDAPFITGWFSRKFAHQPLWKSKMAFFETFADVLYKIEIPIDKQQANEADLFLKKERSKRINAICDEKCKRYVCGRFHLNDEDIIIVKIEPKVRRINPYEVRVLLDNKVKKFSELVHDSFSVIGEQMPFCFWYVNLDKINGIEHPKRKQSVINEICHYVKNLSVIEAE